MVDYVTTILVEIDGKQLYAKVQKDELQACIERTGWGYKDIDSALTYASDFDIENEYNFRGLDCLRDIDDEIEKVVQENIEGLVWDVYNDVICDRDPKEQLNILFREFLGREV